MPRTWWARGDRRGPGFDPRRDVEVYLAAARRRGIPSRYVLYSHGHNDYLSGLSELAGRADL